MSDVHSVKVDLRDSAGAWLSARCLSDESLNRTITQPFLCSQKSGHSKESKERNAD